MKLEILEQVCLNNSTLWNTPYRIYIDSVCYKKFEAVSFEADFAEKYLSRMIDDNKNLSVLLSPAFLMFAWIHIKDTKYSIVIGPSRSVELEESAIRSIVIENNLHLSRIEEVKKYLNSVELMPIENFYKLCIGMNALINDELVSLDTFYSEMILYEVNHDTNEETVKFKNVEDSNYNVLPYLEFEQMLLFYIRNGMVERLNEHLLHWRGRPVSVATDAMRQYKDRCISMTTLVSRECIKGGLNSDLSFKLFDLYCKKVEQATSIDALNNLQLTVIFDYAKRMRECDFEETDNPTINRVISFINRHLNEKLSLEYIADKLKINPGYLSVNFKKNTGISLSSYINQQKVNEAKRLLSFTNESLIEISLYLCFSSQSYFQNVFRKFTGMTPLDYRRQSEEMTGE